MTRRLSAKALSAVLGLIFLFITAQAQDAKPWLKAKPERMEAWKDLRFGMFIHWGPVSLKGTEIGWSRGGERRGVGGKGEIPAEVYDNLYKQFNPTLFNAEQWARIAKDAGMKYMALTTRHHDGFSMFDTKQSDYKITSPDCPFKRDVVKEYSDACRKAGLWLGYYYSQPDWHNADYLTANHANYLKYLHGQMRELLSNYGKVDIVWFDGLGGDAKRWDAENLFKMMRGLQPDLIVNNRCGLPGDWDTSEQKIGAFKNDRPWETCMTICRQWSWKPDDKMKPLKECVQTLLQCVDGDGNLLFNVGPMPDGRIEPRQVERLMEMGAWLKQYGESVYGTRGGPFKPGAWGGSTRKGNTIYLHVFDWGVRGAVTLPAIGKKIVKGALLGGGGEAEVKQTTASITVKVPANKRQEIATVVALELDGLAKDIAPLNTAPEAEIPKANQPPIAKGKGKAPVRADVSIAMPTTPSLSQGKKARASDVFGKNANFGADKVVDGNMKTRWACNGGVHQAWLEVDLGSPQTFNHIMIFEWVNAGERIESYELQIKDGENWKTFHKGVGIGADFDLRFDPITAQVVRLNILQANEGPTVNEFLIFNEPKK